MSELAAPNGSTMYLPAHFEESRTEPLHAFVRAHPLGLLVMQDAHGGLRADAIPFLLDADPNAGPGILRGHVARANPLWRDALGGATGLVAFQGPQAYVSPSLYASKHEHGKVVPTWNYTMVQARGTLRAIDDARWVRALVTRLTERHETPRAAPWKVTDAPEPYIDTMLGAIVGIEMVLTSLTGKWKASQNRSAADRAGVAAGLRDAGIADARLLAGFTGTDREAGD